jgi:hypothetical protein
MILSTLIGEDGRAVVRPLPVRAAALLLAGGLLLGSAAFSQVVPAREPGGFSVFAGGAVSAFTLQYGRRKMLGVSAVVDVDSNGALGLQGEARWLIFNQTAQVNATTWLAGPRYRRRVGRIEIYAKGLAGVGQFNFPYNDAYGRYLVIAPGGGADLTLSNRLRLRLADCEYQFWPQFTFGAMTSYGLSAGLRLRIF